MMEESANRKSSQSLNYVIKKGGLCRILEMVLLTAVEACLGAAAALESDRGLFHQIIVAIPLGSILFLLLSHLILGPHEAWPRLRGCSWPKMETAHDVLVFALLLPSSLALLVPPFTTLEASAAVLTLVAVLLVALQGVDNLQKAQYRSSPPLVSAVGSHNSNIYTRRPRRGNAPNTSAFSPILIPCSTPVCISSKHHSKSPSSPQLYVHEADTASLLNKGLDSEECYSSREPPMRMSPLGAPGTPRSESFTFGTLSALSSRTYVLQSSIESTTCTVSKSPPGRISIQNTSVTPTPKSMSPDSRFLKKSDLDVQGLTLSKISVTERSVSNSKDNQNCSYVKVPVINLIGPTPELKFPHMNRINESEMGSSPLLSGSEALSGHIENQEDVVSPLFSSTVFVGSESPTSVSDSTPIAAKFGVEEPVTPDLRDALVEELGEKLSAKYPNRSKKNITSLKSLDEFSPPKTFFSDESKQVFSDTPQPVARPIIKSSLVETPVISALPISSLHTLHGLPSLPPLSLDYVRVYPTPQPFTRSVSTSLSLSDNLSGTQESSEEKHSSLSKSQSVCGETHHYESIAESYHTQHHGNSSRNQTPYQLLKRKTQTEGDEEAKTQFRFQYTDLTTEL